LIRVALERQSIEKKDFPIGRRGYDPDAVDAHLTSIANEIEELKRASRRKTETLASAASDQVRAIVEAAEASAAEIQRQAEDEAQEIRTEASSEAQATREQATGQAREYVGKVSESTAVMLQRLDAMESELSTLIESLRTGSNRLNADLQLLEGNLTEVSETVLPRRFEPEAAQEPAPDAGGYGSPAPAADVAEPAGAVADAPPDPTEGAGTAADVAEPPTDIGAPLGGVAEAPAEAGEAPTEAGEAAPEAAAYDEPVGEHAAAGSAGAGSDDTEGARLIALNMALNGTPREETDRYLAENFQLADRAGLLDEVYASVEG
jgi:DivIVA domain-containing protein